MEGREVIAMPKVLVVDDSLSVRKVVERALAARSIQVVSAASGSEALTQIQREHPDLVICDVLMPDKDGYQICEFVKAHPEFGASPVLLISGIVNSAVLERAAEVRSDSVMRKPFAADELLQKVEGLLAAEVDGIRQPGAAVLRGPAQGSVPLPSALSALITGPPRPVPEASAPPVPRDLKAVLTELVESPGVALAALVDREGFLIDAVGECGSDIEPVWALASSVAEACDDIGRELGHGPLQAMILEHEGGVVLLSTIGPGTLLALLLRDPTILGRVRYSVKRTQPELLRLL